MAQLILGLTGFSKAGKSTSAKYLRDRYRARIFRNSEILEATLRLWDLPLDRVNYSDLCRAMTRWKGQGVIAAAYYGKIRQTLRSQLGSYGHALIVIDGIRMPGEVRILHTMEEFKLASVSSSFSDRFERINRNPEKDDEVRGMSRHRFLLQHVIWAERRIPWCMFHADTEIQNYGTPEELHERLDVMMERYGFPKF